MSDSSIERLQKKINERGATQSDIRRGVLHEKRTASVPDDWEHEHGNDVDEPKDVHAHKTHRARSFFIFALVFFLISLSISALVIFRGANVVNPPVISVTGPAAVDAGGILALEVGVANENTVPLRNVDLLIDYPRGTRSPADVTTEQTRLRIPLGDLASGSRITESASAALFGPEGDVQDIIITVEYRIDGSNAVFVKKSQYSAQIGDAPLLLQVDAPEEVISGDDITMQLDLVSNTSDDAESLVVVAEYPFGFEFESADPAPVLGNNVWRIDALESGETYGITVRGALEGQNGEERTFEVRGGVARLGEPNKIGSELFASQHSIQITRPFVSANLALNGSDDPVVVTSGSRSVKGVIKWFNTLPEPVSDIRISAELSGSALDESAIDAGRGFYNSVTNELVWSESEDSDLRLVDAGESGEFRFSLAPKDIVRAGIVNGFIDIALTVEGVRSQTGSPVVFSTNATIQVLSDTAITSEYEITSGQNPPVPEVPSTIQVTLRASTASNDVGNTRVVARVPSYMTWLGGSEDLSYNASRREITWDIGTLRAGTGYTTPPRTVEATLQLLPSVSQANTQPLLLTDIKMTGTDMFVDEPITTVGDDMALDVRVEG